MSKMRGVSSTPLTPRNAETQRLAREWDALHTRVSRANA